MMHMLIVDGIKYRLWAPKDEEKEFHPMVKKHSKEIFGNNSVYFDVKHMIKSESGIASIPDAYVISLAKPYHWFIVENELSYHKVYKHIIPQVVSFMQGIENFKSQREIYEVLYREITKSESLKRYVEKEIKPEEISHFLTNLTSQPPNIAVIIDKVTDEARNAYKYLKKMGDTELVEFETYVKENDKSIRAHLFNPIAEGLPCEGVLKQDIEQKKSEMLEYAESDKLRELLSECFRRFDVLNLEMKPLKGHWISVWYEGKRFMQIAARQKFFNVWIMKPDGNWLECSNLRNREELGSVFKKQIVPTLEEYKAKT